ncbi:hypothetical protein LINPERHAP1_LOCUS17625 [Linum perenne]
MVLCRRNRDVRQLEVLSEMKLGSASQPLLLIWASAPSLEPSSAEPSQVSVKGIMLPTFWLTLVIHFLLDSTFFLPQIVISATFCAETVWVSLNPVLLLMSKVP